MSGSNTYDGQIENVGALLREIASSNLTLRDNSHVGLWFRGHSLSDWKLEPGVYRSNFYKGDEANCLLKEQRLAQDFRILSAGLLTGKESDVELYYLQQHYGMPTRLLDWSTNPLSALFFAIGSSKKHDGEDGKFYMMDAYGLWETQKKNPDSDIGDFIGIATDHHPVTKEALQVISHWKKLQSFKKFIIPIRPSYIDRRISLQRSGFTFHVPYAKELTKDQNETLKTYLIPKDAKVDLRRELALLGIDDFSTFGDLQGLSKTLIKNHLID